MTTLIALCGMPGSGKSTVSQHAMAKWRIPTYYAGQILVDECRRQGIVPSYKNVMQMGEKVGLFLLNDQLKFLSASYEDMRERFPAPRLVIFDSLRSIEELDYVRQFENVMLIGVVLDRDERYRRLRRRDGVTDGRIGERDLMELGYRQDFQRKLDVGHLLASADYYILTPRYDPPSNLYFDKLDFIFAQVLGIDLD